VVPTQVTPGAVQLWLVQHGCAAPPQLPQLPLEQLPPTVGQVLPEPVQMSLTQQPLEVQLLPAQQVWPALPHCAQTPLAQA
jgi:hypothetical protein